MMANTLTSIILAFLFSVSAAASGGRTKLLSGHGQDSISALKSSGNDDGICSSIVEKQGYVCEEHKVVLVYLQLIALQLFYQAFTLYVDFFRFFFCYFEVITRDGYILSIQRIPAGRPEKEKAENKQPVLLQHGVLMVGISLISSYCYRF